MALITLNEMVASNTDCADEELLPVLPARDKQMMAQSLQTALCLQH